MNKIKHSIALALAINFLSVNSFAIPEHIGGGNMGGGPMHMGGGGPKHMPNMPQGGPTPSVSIPQGPTFRTPIDTSKNWEKSTHTTTKEQGFTGGIERGRRDWDRRGEREWDRHRERNWDRRDTSSAEAIIGAAIIGTIVGAAIGSSMEGRDLEYTQNAMIYTPIGGEKLWVTGGRRYIVRPIRSYSPYPGQICRVSKITYDNGRNIVTETRTICKKRNRWYAE